MSDAPGFEKLAAASAEAHDWTHAAIHLAPMLSGTDDPAQPYLAALEYILTIDEDSDQQQRWGSFGPMMELEGFVRPIPLDQAPESWLARWAEAAEAANDPLVASRLHDLLWERKYQRPDVHCREAIKAYRSLGTGRWLHEYAGYLALGRAVQLSQQIGDAVEVTNSIADFLSYLQAGLEDSPPACGLMAAEFLAQLPPAHRPTPDLINVLESVIDRGDLDVNHISEASGLLAKLSPDPDTARGWRRRQVGAWLDEANRSTGLVRAHTLDRALAIASNFGLSDLADQARLALQSITEDQLDLKKVSAQIDIPSDHVEAFLGQFVGDDSWQQALERFGARQAPAGDVAQNAQGVREQMQRFPLQYLVTKRLLNAVNLPVAIIASEADHYDAALREREAWSIGIWGVFAAPVLDRVRERYGQPSKDELTEFFSTVVIPGHVAERIARSIELWWEGQPDECAHLLLPRLEAVIRDMARQVGLVIYREPSGRNRGGVRMLGTLLGELPGRMDESWRRHLMNLLTDELGYNLRNLVLHGLIPRVERVEAALLINAGCYLRLLRIGPAEH